MAHKSTLKFGLLSAGAAVALGCSVVVHYNSGQTVDQARAAAQSEGGISLCDAIDTPNIGFETPAIPAQMTYNSYPSVPGWRSPRGELLVGRGNLDLPLVPDAAAYGDQHGILKPRRADVPGEQANTTLEYDLHVTPGQRYVLVFSAAAASEGTDLTLTLTGAIMTPYTFATRTDWRQRVVPFSATGDTVTVRFQTGLRSDVGAFALGRGEVDVYVDVAGVFPVCPSGE